MGGLRPRIDGAYGASRAPAALPYRGDGWTVGDPYQLGNPVTCPVSSRDNANLDTWRDDCISALAIGIIYTRLRRYDGEPRAGRPCPQLAGRGYGCTGEGIGGQS